MKIMQKLQTLLLVLILMVTSFFQLGNVFAQESVGVTYRTHVQNIGWMDWESNGESSGTTGQSLRMEAIEIKLVNAPENASIEYFVHVQNIGHQIPDRKNGELAGTEGQSLRLEALHINLKNMPGYSVEYRGHVQNIGWQDWVSDGAMTGTMDQGLRLEAVEIRIVKTGPSVQPTSVSLDKTTDTIAVGTTDTLTAAVLPADAANKAVTWSSDNTSVATVSTTGVVTGVSMGTANITATTVDGGFTASCAVTVTAPAAIAVTGVSLNKAATSITTGATDTLTATVSPANATNKAVTWSSSNTAVATVNSTGIVTGVSTGTATITATSADGSFTASSAVTVTASTVAVTGVSLNKTATSITEGTTETLAATVLPANATNKTVTWSSSLPGVASVSNTGVVTGVNVGAAKITATTVDGNFKAVCAVDVITAATYPVN